MCFSPPQKFQKYFLKYYNDDKNIKHKLSKAQIYIKSNKELISRNYEKLKYKDNSFQKEKNKINNNIGIILLNNNQLLNKSNLNNSKINNPSKSNINYNLKEKKLISNYSFKDNSLSPKNNYNNFKNNSFFNIGNSFKNISKIKSENNIEKMNKKKINKTNSLLNIKNISKDNNNINKFCLNLNNKKNNKITRNHKNKNIKKITKFPLSPNFSKIKSIYLSLTTRQKTPNFTKSLSINYSSNSVNNITKIISDKNEKKKNIPNDYLNDKNNKNKDNKKDLIKNNDKKINDNILFRNKLKKAFFKYINKDISETKDKKKDSMNLFSKLYMKMKSKRSSSCSNMNIPRSTNKNISYMINSNDMASSGSMNFSFQEEMTSEEIHFKSVKLYQALKKEILLLD